MLVVDDHGQLAGIFTTTNVFEALIHFAGAAAAPTAGCAGHRYFQTRRSSIFLLPSGSAPRASSVTSPRTFSSSRSASASALASAGSPGRSLSTS